MEHSLYIHIPFCESKCLYCDFVSYSNLAHMQQDYVKALLTEMRFYRGTRIRTIFMGGGTPTCLAPGLISAVLKGVRDIFNVGGCVETTVEANPGTLTKNMLTALKGNGADRLSIGLQSWNPEELRTLGRIHNRGEFVENFRKARDTGFDNINVDLIFGIPGQTMDSWKETLNATTAMQPEHISCYSLKIEEGTGFHRMLNQGILHETDPDLDREMYHYAAGFLENSGYNRYEISNFALKGRECAHNLAYWRNMSYIGVGASAHSYTGRVRRWNVPDIHRYCSLIERGHLPVEGSENIPEGTEMFETVFLNLRTRRGIDFCEFKERFGTDIRLLYKDRLKELEKEGLVDIDEEGLRLTNMGIDLSNRVFIEFLR